MIYFTPPSTTLWILMQKQQWMYEERNLLFSLTVTAEAHFGWLSAGSWYWSHYKGREETTILRLPKLCSAANQCFWGNNKSNIQSLERCQKQVTSGPKEKESELIKVRAASLSDCERSQSRFVKVFETIITLDSTCQANPLSSLNKELCCILQCPFLFRR